MMLRLDLELMWRRYGRYRVVLAAMALGVGFALLAPFASRPAAPVLVEAVDGSRQQEANYRAFRTLLIPRDAVEVRQGAVIEMLSRHGLAVGHIDYGIEQRAAGQFALASLQMPLRGRYTDLRTFLAEVLTDQPAVAITDLAIQRDANGAEVEARIKLTFLTEPPGAEGRP